MGHEIPRDVVLVLEVSAGAAFAMDRLRVPVITGYLLAGVLVGPAGLGVVTTREPIEVLAEVGVVLLLFTVGLKLSLTELGRLRSFVFGSGSLQVGLTVAAVAAAAGALGLGLARSLIWGSSSPSARPRSSCACSRTAPRSTAHRGAGCSACCCSRTSPSCR